jgi:hypothetical protein
VAKLVWLYLDEPNWSYEFFKSWLHLNQNIKKVFWKSTLHRRPWVLSKLIPTVIPLRHYSLESLTAHKTPWPFLLLPRGPSAYENSNRGRKKGGAAYRRRERSGEGRGWLREVLAVTARYGSTAVVAGISRSMCAGGWTHRWRVLRPNHGGIGQSKGTRSFTGCWWVDSCKELKNNSPWSLVYIHRRSGEVRRPWTGFSGEAKFDSLLGELHRGMHGLLLGSDTARRGSAGWSTVAGDQVAAGTPCAGQCRWSGAPVRSSACRGVRLKSLGAL